MPSRLPSSVLALLLVVVAVGGSGCAASVTRTGYEAPRPVALAAGLAAATCPVVITADTLAVASAAAERLGEIRYSDSGFSTQCDEARALRLFEADACHLGADVVLLTDERSPSFWSTCYRATAQFYRVGDSAALVDVADRRDPDRLVVNRGAESSAQAMGLIAGVAGAVAGSLLVSLLLGTE